MKRFGTLLLFSIFCINLYAWGPTGHRVIGAIADRHLSKKARKNINKVLQGQNLAMSGNWMDLIRSDHSYDSLKSWHYVTIPSWDKYHHEGQRGGDVLLAITRFKDELETKQYSVDEAFALKCLIHLVADLHQPLHVGNGLDRGGNQVKVKFFGKSSNLHTVWDSGMIDHQKLSFSEYTCWIDKASKEQMELWKPYDLEAWAKESMSFRTQIYDLPESGYLSYPYVYKNIDTVNLRLLQAGIRLAEILNSIYG